MKEEDIVVSIEEALSFHGREDVVFVDGSWHLDKSRSAVDEFEGGPRIAGAHFFDIDGLNPHENLPHMMPPWNILKYHVQTNILTQNPTTTPTTVIVYGTQGAGKFTARAWYTLFCFASLYNNNNNEKSSLAVRWMQGSLKEWQEQGGPVDINPQVAIATPSTALSITDDKLPLFPQMVSKQDVIHVIDGTDKEKKVVQLIDARSEARFRAEAPEPRPELRVGHMPGAINIPFSDCLTKKEHLKPVSELKLIFTEKNIDVGTTTDHVYISCGSGVTASTVALALIVCGRSPQTVHIYDGSWAEWGADPNTPIIV
eukprot:CAMPEP_0197828894 /NCGR_PEP_ID=MMETSP1437-20131217/5396_1 /TAXON_ID=49252 ORGANISM="Eucampia antarctica, Strain CCMP1452" /NCGR_SAMPLE_ID=MMETSP1437 /ASSEMBLY_ACC=CAM_ASM_001096 /LENGTH=313 /DNA_ID=CAMNT_0043430305 /DNA_START=184 /DNA_END=1125 /DNA_ORIENTATION=+